MPRTDPLGDRCKRFEPAECGNALDVLFDGAEPTAAPAETP